MDIYQQNLNALQKINPLLAKELSSIVKNKKYEVFQGDTHQAINILDKSLNMPLYDNPINELRTKTQEYTKLREYPFLYFFGVGNGNEIKHLLENEKLERLVLIEPNIELLYIALHLHDFSKYIDSLKLILLSSNQLTFELAIRLFGKHKSRFYAKVYDLNITLPYYDNYPNEIQQCNEILIKAIHYVISFSGNDVTDNLIGLKHHIQNIPEMLKNGKFSELIKQKNSDLAIIVSTGPSLHKQLPLLKKIQDFITIISVDASLPILEKNDIKPDIVTSIERVALTSSFFKNTSEIFQKDIVFLSVSLQHKETLNAIKGQKVLVMRPFDYNHYFELNEYGYIGSGMSSANLAHELAMKMGYKKIILIGQDLAFAKDGKSHSQDHVLGENDVKKDKIETSLVTAYGGHGKVISSSIWILFKNSFEQNIEAWGTNIQTINATEGGARIEGSIEMPFKNVIEQYIKRKKKKEKITINKSTNEKYEEHLNTVKNKISNLLQNGEQLLEKIEKSFLIIYEECVKLENKTREEALRTLTTSETLFLLNEIEKIRNTIDTDSILNQFYYDFIQSDLLHIELNLATVKVRFIDNPKDNQQKALEWILLHRDLLFTLAGTLKNTMNIIKESQEGWDV